MGHRSKQSILGILAIGLVATLASPTIAGDTKPKPLNETRSLSPEESAAELLLIDYYKAYDERDSGAMRELVLSGRAFTQIASRGARIGWSNYTDTPLREEFRRFDQTKSSVSLLSYDRVANGAYVVFRNVLETMSGQQPETLEMLGTAFLETTGTHWFIRHIHTSDPMQVVENVDLTTDERKHPLRDVGDYESPPTVDLKISKDAVEGWNLELAVSNFEFMPERAGAPYLKGQGHLQLYIDDQKVARIYSNWFHIGDLSPGRHKVKVVLTGTDHSVLANKGEIIASEVEVQQSQQVADR